MANRRTLRFLFFAFTVFVLAGLLFLVLWKLGIGEWAFLASIISIIIGTTILLYILAQVDKRETKISNRRVSFLVFAPLALMAAGALFFGFWKIGAGEWALFVSMLSFALAMFTPALEFIIQPNLTMTMFSGANAPNDWGALHPMRRAVIYFGTVICLVIGVVILLYVSSRMLSR